MVGPCKLDATGMASQTNEVNKNRLVARVQNGLNTLKILVETMAYFITGHCIMQAGVKTGGEEFFKLFSALYCS